MDAGNMVVLYHIIFLFLIFYSKRYNIVHSHMDAGNMVVLREAKKCGIPIRISHSHNTQHITSNKIKFHLNPLIHHSHIIF